MKKYKAKITAATQINEFTGPDMETAKEDLLFQITQYPESYLNIEIEEVTETKESN